ARRARFAVGAGTGRGTDATPDAPLERVHFDPLLVALGRDITLDCIVVVVHINRHACLLLLVAGIPGRVCFEQFARTQAGDIVASTDVCVSRALKGIPPCRLLATTSNLDDLMAPATARQ